MKSWKRRFDNWKILHFAQVRTNIVGTSVPAKPVWYSRINDIIRELQTLPRPFVDRATVEFLLGVGRRRAQQILAPCIRDRVGTNGLADREAFIAHLRRLAEGDDGYYERLGTETDLPTTSQPSIGDFLEVYERLLDAGQDIVSIHLAGGMSGTVRSAEQAREQGGAEAVEHRADRHRG